MFIRNFHKMTQLYLGQSENVAAPAAVTGDPVSKGGTGGSQTDTAAELAALKAENAALKAAAVKPPESPDLKERARLQKEAEDKDTATTKKIESALGFNLKSAEFLSQNESLLPAEVAGIFKEADKETYANAIEKANAIKSGLIQSFFAVQSNMDLLTPTVKSKLDDYLKLTKNGKQDKAQEIYDSVFEPAFEMLKRVKKAEALNRGLSVPTDAEAAYRNRMIDLSKKHYLGEK